MANLRGGMIGAGAWSEIQLTAWEGVKGAEIVALCDRHPERRDPLATQFGIEKRYDVFERMLDDGGLDFVDICVRPYSHAPLIKLAVERRLPILCQKPFCTSLTEACEVVALCEGVGVRLMVNENFRWQAWYRKARELLQSGAMGTPFWARIQRRMRLTLPGFEHRQAYFAEMPHLVGYEMGVHYLDTLRFLFGDPQFLFARVQRISPHIKGDDLLVADLIYTGMTAQVTTSWASVEVPGIDVVEDPDEARAWSDGVPPPRLEIEGTEGTLVLMPDRTLRLARDEGLEEWPFDAEVRIVSRIVAQQHFVDCLQSGGPFETSGEETLKTMALVWGCYRASEENRVVRPDELLQEARGTRSS